MIDAVLDTSVFLRGLIHPRSRWGRLIYEHESDYTICTSIPALRELLDVITRPELVRKYRGVASRDLQVMLGILARARVVEPAEIGRVCRDPKDDVFLATAVAAGSAYLVSEDRDLLDLGTHGTTQIVDAATFLTALAGSW